MSDDLATQLRHIRQSFDAGFAHPVGQLADGGTPMLVLESAGERLALRTSELTGLHLGRRIVAVPGSGAGGLLGLCGIQGRLVAVYSLSVLLGSATAEGSPRWLCLPASSESVGLAFNRLEQYVSVHASDLRPLEASSGRGHVHEWLTIEGRHLPVVDLSYLMAELARAPHLSPQQRGGA